MNQADHHVEHHQHAEVHQIHTQQLGRRQQHGHKHQQQNRHIQKAAQHQKHHVDQQQKLELRQLHAVDPLRHGLRHAFCGEGVVQNERAGQNHGDHRTAPGGLEYHAPESAPGQRAVNHGRQHQGMERGHCSCFSGRESAGVNSAQQHDGHGQRQGTAENDVGPVFERNFFFTRHIAFNGNEMHDHHHQQGHQNARHHATQKQRTHRRAGDQRVDDHRNGGRNDGAQRGTGHHHGGGKSARVLGLFQHLAYRHQTGASSVCNSAAAHA